MILILAGLLAAGGTTTVASPPLSPPLSPPQSAPLKPAPAVVAESPKLSRAEVMAAVRAEWPRYDTAGRGKLTPLEFSTWVMRAHGAQVAPRAHVSGISPVSAMNASSTAFARADADHDGGVTPDEMTRFLMLPPAPTPTALMRTSVSTGAVAHAPAR